jgi:hypothetical protein
MKFLFGLMLIALTGCSSVDVYSPKRISEDSINWEYDRARSFNTNNNLLDSPDGSVQKGNGIKVFKAVY